MTTAKRELVARCGRAVVLLTVLLGGALPAAGQQARLEFGFGSESAYRPGCWTPVRVTVRRSDSFDGTAYIYPAGALRQAPPTRFERDVVLTGSPDGGVAEHFWLYVRPGGPFSGVAGLDGGGERVTLLEQEQVVRMIPLDERDHVFLVAGGVLNLKGMVDPPNHENEVSEKDPYAADYSAIHASTATLPDMAIGYDGIDTLVLVDLRVSSQLMQPQIDAIGEFVERGGRLVVLVEGRNYAELATSRLAGLLPVTFADHQVAVRDTQPLLQRARAAASVARPRPAIPSFRGSLDVPWMQPKEGAGVLLESGGVPLAVAGVRGSGSVVVLADARALRSWPGYPMFLASLLGLSPPIQSQTMIGSRRAGESIARFAVSEGAVGSVAFVWAILLMSVAYIAFGGPILHVVLKLSNRLTLSWPIFLGISLVTALGCFAIVSGVRNRQMLHHSAAIIDYPAASKVGAVGRSWHNIRFPWSSRYRVELETDRGALSLSSETTGVFGAGGDMPVCDASLTWIDNLAVKSNQFRDFKALWRPPNRPPATVEITDIGLLAGRVANGPTQLRSVVLVGPQTTRRLGTLAPNQEIRLDAESRPDRRPVATDVYLRRAVGVVVDRQSAPMSPYGPPEVQPPASVREAVADVVASSFFEAYRRAPRTDPGMNQRWFRRGEAGRSLDLTEVLDAGGAVLIGEAELDVPDGLRVDGRETKTVKRLVVFRQVVTAR